jgi:predicted flavoprotein YhiN
MMVASTGIEGGAVYELSGSIRDALDEGVEPVEVHLDLKPDLDAPDLARRLAARRSGRSLSQFLTKDLRLTPLAYPLLREVAAEIPEDPKRLADLLKRIPLPIVSARPIAEAISSAGGVAFDAVDEHLMLRKLPGVFVAGEMLDWEAPTGGYLLQGAFATGVAAARGALAYLNRARP